MVDGSMQPHSRVELPRREVMQTPEEVAAMLRLKELGWGVRRIARELGCSHMTVRRYVAVGGWAGEGGGSPVGAGRAGRVAGGTAAPASRQRRRGAPGSGARARDRGEP